MFFNLCNNLYVAYFKFLRNLWPFP